MPIKWSSWLLALLLMPAIARGQQTMTVTGHVTASGRPVAGASVRVPDIRIDVVTDADGRYSFIIPSASVRGQTVTMSARSVRLPTVSVQVALRGGTLVQDFDLTPAPGTQTTPEPVERAPETGRITDRDSYRADARLSQSLAGRFAGLQVAVPPTPGASATLNYRGARSIAASAAPLIIVNGVELDRTRLRDASARLGFGGFDFGDSFDDIDPADVLSMRLLTPLQATAELGARAGNGALMIETRDGRGVNGTELFFRQRLELTSPTQLPEFQNEFGQGSAGVFSFFDGKGGGLNDGVARSWGPALDGRPLTQASLVESGRPDVRHWLPHPDNVSGFFENGRTLITNAAVSRGSSAGNVHAAINAATDAGAYPGNRLSRYGANFRGSRELGTRLTVDAFGSFVLATANNRAVTGFDNANPVINLVRTPRQVDIAALSGSLRDADGAPINWIYTGSSNPWFAARENGNEDSRRHHTVGAGATWSALSWLSIAGRVGRDAWNADREFSIATGWIGGFATDRGRSTFSDGGYQSQDLGVRTNFGEVTVTTSAVRAGALSAAVTGGGRRRSHHSERSSIVYDSAAVGTDAALQAAALTPVESDFWNHTWSFFGRVNGTLGSALSFSAGATRDAESMFGDDDEAHVSPFALANFDVGQSSPGFVRALGLDALSFRGGWGRTSTPLMPNESREIYAGAISPDGIVLNATPVVLGAADVGAELVTTREAGVNFSAAGRRLDAGLTFYSDRSSSVIVARPEGADMLATNGGVVTNLGLEAHLIGVLSRAGNREWSVTATLARNDNEVESLPGGLTSIPLGPSRWNVRLEGLNGSAVSTIVGSTFLRDPSGALLLRNGLPIADTTAATGIRALGVAEPDWFGGLSTDLRYRAVDFSVRVDGQVGGRFFSATNRLGATSGTFAETAFRPDTGLLVAGIDSATGTPNTVHVSTEDYYTALGDVAERWVYDASFLKLREVRMGVTVALPGAGPFRTPTLRASIFGRNLLTLSRAPNVDPESAFGMTAVRGLELGQLPGARSVGIRLTIVP